MLTPQGPIQHLKALVGMLTQIECQSLTRRVLYHQQNWGVLTQDNWVLQTVQGYLIDLTHTPHQSHIPPPIDLSQEKHALVTQEVQKLLSKGAIVESIPFSMSFISQIFLVEKGGSTASDQPKGLEPICASGTLQNGGSSPDTRLTPTKDWMVKMDLKDVYLQIPMHPDYQHLLQFIWGQKHFKFQCLPFDLSSAPWVFTKLLKPVVGFLRQIGLRLIVYLDDMLFMHTNKDQLEAMAPLICKILKSLA